MTTQSTETFSGTITNGCTPKIIGRVIGIRGTGIRRITNKIRDEHLNSKPYIRADRNTNKFTLTTKGDTGRVALEAMALLVTNEIEWITTGTGICPHPMINVPGPSDKSLNKHIIGTSGIFLRNITNRIARGENGPGCFIVHKPDLGCYCIEGVTQAQVELGARRLRAHIATVTTNQTPTHVDLEHRGEHHPRTDTLSDDNSPVVGPTTDSVSANTNRFDALETSSSDDDDNVKHTFLQAKNEVAVQKNIPFQHVKDHEVDSFMLHGSSASVDFPPVGPTTDDNVKLMISSGAWANGPSMAVTNPSQQPSQPPSPPPTPTFPSHRPSMKRQVSVMGDMRTPLERAEAVQGRSVHRTKPLPFIEGFSRDWADSSDDES